MMTAEETAAVAERLGWHSITTGPDYVTGFPPGVSPHPEDDREPIPQDAIELAELTAEYHRQALTHWQEKLAARHLEIQGYLETQNILAREKGEVLEKLEWAERLLKEHHEASNLPRLGRLLPGDRCPVCEEAGDE